MREKYSVLLLLKENTVEQHECAANIFGFFNHAMKSKFIVIRKQNCINVILDDSLIR